ncbi:bile acid:sodium symporter family protein [Carboxylicivirga taeanensis]|uniref:bile acid:sodium symporter family protein n=1 Tax=Carboxylicivirga taeanensis TaxID=1416875 RepID=UPI003F6E2B87
MLKKIDGFILGLIGMIFLAWIFPQAGVYKGAVNLEVLTDIGIALIFFFYGLKLSPQQMKEGLSNYRLHVLVQLSTFLLFPLLVLVFLPLMQTEEQYILWLAMFFLAALPSTVSSSVVMVVLAKGNMPGAIFNASISGLIGIVVTPLWMGLFWKVEGASFDFTSIFQSLLIKILVPVIAGLLLHRYWGALVKRHLKLLARFDKTVILLIVYKSFSNSFSSGLFSTVSLLSLLIVGLASVALFGLVYYCIAWMAGRMHFNREDRIAALFCGSKKSLVHGTVFSKVLFQHVASQGLFLVPIMVYHAFQLIIVSFIAQRKGQEVVE